MIEAIIAASAGIVGDIIKAASSGSDVPGLVAAARAALRRYHAADATARAKMRDEWNDTLDALWPTQDYRVQAVHAAHVAPTQPAPASTPSDPDTLPGVPSEPKIYEGE